ncbi:glutamate-1-semialdehyde-2,1-aminomutase [candidate division KSB1 bacterium]|nr:MAG: glutamate-1-semialdehyde-2,1-aminomutase [candidate division KSB1 bacterium]MBC6950603.1 glutamate-1-semialdehyde-2,1-aminomutase [candidate division KSB1 bacterium]MCE7942860.1 glutamate-1-semialdehyde-2,1-aminomutase [Chlorobi bacterium CHB1]
MSSINIKSVDWFGRAQSFFPGGVNSPVRAFKAVGGVPPVLAKGEGSYVYDIDGNRYLDFVGSWGPLIAGHAHPEVVEAAIKAIRSGSSFGAPTPAELELAELIKKALPAMELLRFVSSGTEATMSALRLARGFTGREKIIKFAGCYHGHADLLLAQAGSGVATLGLPDSPGVPRAVTQDTIVLPYNDLPAVEQVFARQGREIAAIIVEPIAGNMGMVMPQAGFLAGLRRLTAQAEAVLIFDEVMTGFRVARGSAQALFGITPDLTCLGKVIGGGFPCAAFGGKREIMQKLAPLGPVYQAGTLSGNPVAMAAGAATLRLLEQNAAYKKLNQHSQHLTEGLARLSKKYSLPLQVAQAGGMLGMFFAPRPVHNYDEARTADTKRYARFFHEMLNRGFYFAPSQFEAAFVSLAHTPGQIEETLVAASEVFALLASAAE